MKKRMKLFLAILLAACLVLGASAALGDQNIEQQGPCDHEVTENREEEISPTCDSAGQRTVITYCTACHAELSRESTTLPALGHDWGAWTVEKAPGFGSEGLEVRTCSRGHSESRTIPALEKEPEPDPDAWGEWFNSKIATCEEPGQETRFTNNRARYETRTIPAKGHYWGEWETVTPATIQEEGLEKRVCVRNAAHEETRPIGKVPSLKLTDKTSVDLTGLMKWDNELNRTDPVITVNGKKFHDLSEEEQAALANNRETMEFLLGLLENPEAEQRLQLDGLDIRVDRSRLDDLVSRAKKGQANRDIEIKYKQEQEDEQAKKEQQLQEDLKNLTSDLSTTWNNYSENQTEDIRISVDFKQETEKIRFEETNKQNETQEPKKFETEEKKDNEKKDKKKNCLTPDTLILLADGSEKRVDELKDDDRLAVWDFDEGQLSEAPLTFFHIMEEEAEVLRISFSDGTEVGIIGEHVFFDLTDRKFVAISEAAQAEELAGHSFAKLADGKITEVTLKGIREDGTAAAYYSPVTEAHFNCFANGMLNISGFMDGFYNVFDLEADELKYNAERKAADWAAMGDLPEELFGPVASHELFARNRAGWLSVSVGKGLITAEDLYALFEFCGPFFVGGK